MVRVGWVGVRRLDFDDACRLKQQVEAVKVAAGDAEMAAIQHEFRSNARLSASGNPPQSWKTKPTYKRSRHRYLRGSFLMFPLSQTRGAGCGQAQIVKVVTEDLISATGTCSPIDSRTDQSDVWPDIVYTLGSKPEELQSFIKLAKENPGAAIRKAVLIEHLITQELSKGGKSVEAGDTPKVVAIRDESGRFQKTPEKEESDAPPPPREVSGRGSNPPDEVASAVKTNDFRRFRDSQNAKDLSRNRRR